MSDVHPILWQRDVFFRIAWSSFLFSEKTFPLKDGASCLCMPHQRMTRLAPRFSRNLNYHRPELLPDWFLLGPIRRELSGGLPELFQQLIEMVDKLRDAESRSETVDG